MVMTNSSKDKKNVQKIITNIATIFVLVFLALVVAFTVATLFVVDAPKPAPNGKRYLTLSKDDTILDAIEGDMLVVQSVEDFTAIEVGDVITYALSDGSLLTRAIIEKFPEPHANGSTTYCYKVESELAYVHPNQIYGLFKVDGVEVGKVVKGYGNFTGFLRTGGGYMLFVITPILLVLAYFIIKLVFDTIDYSKEKAKEELKVEGEQSLSEVKNVQIKELSPTEKDKNNLEKETSAK